MISPAGIDLIKRWEGFSATPYLCPAGIWTIGYGHTRGAKNMVVISEAEAERLLRIDLNQAINAVTRLTYVPLTQSQIDALISFVFNLGAGAYQRSTLRQKLNRGEYQATAGEFRKWVYAKGKKLPGLVARREEEARMFCTELNQEKPERYAILPWLRDKKAL